MRYAVIGAGVLGLTAALRLGQQGHEVTVLEQSEVPGGLASSFEVAPGIWLERFYHHIFGTDKRAIALIRELGLADRLRWHRPVTTVMVHGVPKPARLCGLAAALRPSVCCRSTPDGSRDRSDQGHAQSDTARAVDGARLDAAGVRGTWSRGGLGAAPAGQVRRHLGQGVDGLAVGPDPRSHVRAGVPRWRVSPALHGPVCAGGGPRGRDQLRRARAIDRASTAGPLQVT